MTSGQARCRGGAREHRHRYVSASSATYWETGVTSFMSDMTEQQPCLLALYGRAAG
jgi:hypothetical protein